MSCVFCSYDCLLFSCRPPNQRAPKGFPPNKLKAMSIFFKDLGKKAKDLLSKNYTSDGSKEFSIKTKTSDGVTYSAKSTIDGGNVKAKVTTEFKKDKVNFKSLSLDCCGAFAGDITVDEVLDNVRLTLRSASLHVIFQSLCYASHTSFHMR